ncbi:MAG: hypothetical protein M3069_10245 [Chloroflexota bacterium]|nr:hypothetical protein [Chloroflexota bacterium]
MAYIGPETTLPVASSIAACLGFGLLFWRRALTAVRNLLQSRRKNKPE